MHQRRQLTAAYMYETYQNAGAHTIPQPPACALAHQHQLGSSSFPGGHPRHRPLPHSPPLTGFCSPISAAFCRLMMTNAQTATPLGACCTLHIGVPGKDECQNVATPHTYCIDIYTYVLCVCIYLRIMSYIDIIRIMYSYEVGMQPTCCTL